MPDPEAPITATTSPAATPIRTAPRRPGTPADVAEVWRHAPIAGLPAHREGLGMSLLAAAACGRPAVAADVPGCREAVQHAVTGLLVPGRDPPALADALAGLAGDAVRRRAMGAAARIRVAARFGLPAVQTALVALCARRLRSPPG